MNLDYGLHSETKKSRLFKTAIWFIILYMMKLLLNNLVGFVLGSPYVIATMASDIPKVGSTISALKLSAGVGLLLNIGNIAFQFVYPALMAFALLWRGWKIATWLPFAGYAAAAAVYYSVGVQSIEGTNIGLNGLPYYLLIPFVGMLVSVAVQLVLNKIKHGDWLHSYVEPCFNEEKYAEYLKRKADEKAAEAAAEAAKAEVTEE